MRRQVAAPEVYFTQNGLDEIQRFYGDGHPVSFQDTCERIADFLNELLRAERPLRYTCFDYENRTTLHLVKDEHFEISGE